MESHDYVIVGGGTAASVVAYRLGERGHKVCVLEAGPADSSPYIRIPVGWTRTLKDPRVTWQLQYQGSAGTNGRATPLVQGRVLGGSSAVNGAVYNRGQSQDFDLWAAQGNPGWSYPEVLPWFRKSEHFHEPGHEQHRGDRGPMPVTVTPWRALVGDTFLQGAHSVGIPLNPDYNGAEQTGIGYVQSNIRKGRRWSTAHGFLHPARSRFGVRVITDATVTRVVIETAVPAVWTCASATRARRSGSSRRAAWCSVPAPSAVPSCCNCRGSVLRRFCRIPASRSPANCRVWAKTCAIILSRG
jgi:choline dehydrogenase